MYVMLLFGTIASAFVFGAMLADPLSAGGKVSSHSTFQVQVASPLSGMPLGMPAEVRRVGGEDGL